jgi:hypothetical protein
MHRKMAQMKVDMPHVVANRMIALALFAFEYGIEVQNKWEPLAPDYRPGNSQKKAHAMLFWVEAFHDCLDRVGLGTAERSYVFSKEDQWNPLITDNGMRN